MKIVKCAFLVLFLCATVFAQTIDLGQNTFYNDEGAIVIAADASAAVQKLDSPYLMFMLYMGTRENQGITVSRNDVVMIYKDQEYKMPTVKELHANYKGENNDTELYRRMGKEAHVLSRMRDWKYQVDTDFFPPPGQGLIAVDEGSMAGGVGFMTRVYFKNPGFKKGDQIVIRVKDKNKPELIGAVAVIL
jgi:hypothetical protein